MAGVRGNQIDTIRQNMDHRSLNQVTGISNRSTKGLLLYKPCQIHYDLSTNSSYKTNGIERKDSFAVRIKDYASIGHKLIEIMKHNLSYAAKIIQFGSQDKIFRKNFSIKDEEKLLQAFQCYVYTTAGAIAGLLFVSTERVAFCSHRSIKTYSTTGKMLKFKYKVGDLNLVSIPLGKISGVIEGVNMKRPSNNYVELVTVDDFKFWFTGFVNCKKTSRYLHQATNLACLSNS